MEPYFSQTSLPTEPRFEFLFEIELKWRLLQQIPNMPSGAGRGATYVDTGTICGPHLNGRIYPNSGADWALFRPDKVLGLDARYMLEAQDGTLILMRNQGYLVGRAPDVLPRIQAWMFEDGPEVPFEDYYLRTTPTFEVEEGPYDWLMKTVVVGIGHRQKEGNTIRYFALL
ncbi:MAG: hypothetical protein BGP00_21325 [Novosphingobium sp. 63-713]|uniref:DUF3237 domain-containing protein n=1 Tax=unclassified Novosphingobium TaxID=2644732 RepID=UPI0009658F48|nr:MULTISPECIES: DUF3237 domain-containing protein [unclassified Novosphingobium]MBN9142331.1 DUF3237 domain-containing protein [Novosphingobium sp.]OJX90141.1 MAG: hypothetical protein BGP00_21325 [Novosphingobium sp. 63-713]